MQLSSIPDHSCQHPLWIVWPKAACRVRSAIWSKRLITGCRLPKSVSGINLCLVLIAVILLCPCWLLYVPNPTIPINWTHHWRVQLGTSRHNAGVELVISKWDFSRGKDLVVGNWKVSLSKTNIHVEVAMLSRLVVGARFCKGMSRVDVSIFWLVLASWDSGEIHTVKCVYQ